MKSAIDKIGYVAEYILMMIIVNMIIVLVSVVSIGFLFPPIIFIGFYAINGFMGEDHMFNMQVIKWKNILIFTLVCYLQILIVYQYIKIIPYVAVQSINKFVYVAMLILCVYFYIFNMYFMFLSIKDYELKEVFLFGLMAPLHSIKQVIVQTAMFISIIVVLVNIPSLILLIGSSVVLVMNNIMLENYFTKLKG